MKTFECKCGKAKFTGSSTPMGCQGCSECSTNFMGQPIEQHAVKPLVDPYTGKNIPEDSDNKPVFDPRTGARLKRHCQRCRQVIVQKRDEKEQSS